MSFFQQRMVLITGAGSGIGRQLARALSALGAAVAALDRDVASLESLAMELQGRPNAGAVADVTDPEATRLAVGRLETVLGPTEVLIASAGVGLETSALDFRAEDFSDLVRVNLIGVANAIAPVLPGMRERRRGHLVAVSSLASFRGLPRMLGYCASKAGVNALMDGLRVELRPLGITVTTICPGWVRTPMTAVLDGADLEMMEVGEAARHIVSAIRRRKSFYAFPARNALRARLLRYLPHALGDRLAEHYARKALERRTALSNPPVPGNVPAGPHPAATADPSPGRG